jgi:hypothetical protein
MVVGIRRSEGRRWRNERVLRVLKAWTRSVSQLKYFGLVPSHNADCYAALPVERQIFYRD